LKQAKHSKGMLPSLRIWMTECPNPKTVIRRLTFPCSASKIIPYLQFQELTVQGVPTPFLLAVIRKMNGPTRSRLGTPECIFSSQVTAIGSLSCAQSLGRPLHLRRNLSLLAAFLTGTSGIWFAPCSISDNGRMTTVYR
jgi:hypothetical protein